MAYPSILYSYESSEDQFDDLAVDRASNGAARVRAFYTGRKRRFTLVHELLSSTDRDTLTNYYDANRLLSFSMTWADGATYTCIFAAAPKLVPLPGGYWTVTMSLEQV